MQTQHLNDSLPNRMGYSVTEAASVLGLAPSGLWKWIALGKIRSVKIGMALHRPPKSCMHMLAPLGPSEGLPRTTMLYSELSGLSGLSGLISRIPTAWSVCAIPSHRAARAGEHRVTRHVKLEQRRDSAFPSLTIRGLRANCQYITVQCFAYLTNE